MFQRLRVGPLVAIWYASSVCAVWSAKLLLGQLPCPATLCCTQFIVAVAGTRMMLPPAARTSLSGAAESNTVYLVAASYTLGFLVTNAAISIAAPSFVETIKATEPLSTVAMARVILGDRERWFTLMALVPIVVGVAMACSGGSAFSTAGMLLAFASNLAFSGRAVLTKSLKRDHPSVQVTRSDACLFYHVCRCGLGLLIPFALLLDARPLLASFTSGVPGGAVRAGILLALNGLAHALYNGVSFVVLAKVSITTHAVLNIVRRVLVIAIAASIFSTPISKFNWVGVSLAVLGVVAFAQSKAHGSMRTRPKGLLPV